MTDLHLTDAGARGAADRLIGRSSDFKPQVPKIDQRYVFKVLVRHGKLAVMLALLSSALSLVLSLRVRDVYQSTVVAAFNRRDGGELTLDGISSLVDQGIDAKFEARMNDPDFLGRVAESIGLRTEGRISLWLKSMGWSGEESEQARRARLAAYFSQRIVPITGSGAGLLTLRVQLDDTPAKSQDLAATAMEMFITEELQADAAFLGIKLEFLNRALADIREQIEGKDGDAHKEDNGQSAPSSQGKGKEEKPVSMDRRQREAELQDRIRAAEKELASMNEERVRRRALLENEYQRLSSKLAPSHPDVIAKQRELESAAAEPDEFSGSVRNISRLRRDLWLTRSEMFLPAVGESTQGSLAERLQNSRVAMLVQKIEELDLERQSLQRQATDPTSRTRLKVIRSATYDVKPFARKRLQAIAAGLALSLLLAIGSILLREAKDPVARDAWRLSRVTSQPLLAQLARESVDRYPRVSPQGADELRACLFSKLPEDKVAARTLLAYRRAELAISRFCRGRVLCFAPAGADDATVEFVISLANIMATDIDGKLLVIDGDPSRPISSESDGGGADFLSVLAGKHSWRDVIKKADAERAFDLLSIGTPVSGEGLRSLRPDLLNRFFTDALSHYTFIFVRALPESLFIENAALVGAATDLVIGVDARRTTFDEVARSIVHLGEEKLRGLVLIGS